MIPESKLIRSELTLRELSLPDDVLLARKSLVRWLALSFGMIAPNETRRLLLDILDVLLEFQAKKETPTTRDIVARLEEMAKKKQNPKAVYYHLQKLMESGLLTRRKGRYCFGDDENKSLSEIFRGFYVKKTDMTFTNITKALEKLEGSYR